MDKSQSLQSLLDKSIDNKSIFGTSFAIKKGDFSWTGHAGNFSSDQQYFIASTTKLFTTAIILNFVSNSKLSLDDAIKDYLDDSVLKGLHVFKGVDYSSRITIRHLLSHTSGLPDYFQNKGPDGVSLEDELILEKDVHWTFDEAISRAKEINPLFAPGANGKAHYSDTNFQLLGRIIELVSKRTFDANCEELIVKNLGLEKTYMFRDADDVRPKTLYYKNRELRIPKAMSSFGPDGGMVSTSSDMLIFIEAFFKGKFFPIEYIVGLQKWNRIFFPMKSGIGIHLFKLPWFFNPFGTVPYFIGHSGLSGALAFYSPEKEIFIAGTVNQVAHPDLSFKMMIKLAHKL